MIFTFSLGSHILNFFGHPTKEGITGFCFIVGDNIVHSFLLQIGLDPAIIEFPAFV